MGGSLAPPVQQSSSISRWVLPLLLGLRTGAAADLACPAGTLLRQFNLTCAPYQSLSSMSIPSCATGCTVCGAMPWLPLSRGQVATWSLNLVTGLPASELLVTVAGLQQVRYSIDSLGSVSPGDQLRLDFNGQAAANMTVAPSPSSGCGACNSGDTGPFQSTNLTFYAGVPSSGPQHWSLATTTVPSLWLSQAVAVACSVPALLTVAGVTPRTQQFPTTSSTWVVAWGTGFRATSNDDNAAGWDVVTCSFGGVLTQGVWLNFTAARCPIPSQAVLASAIPGAGASSGYPVLLSVAQPGTASPVFPACGVPVCLQSTSNASACENIGAIVIAGVRLCASGPCNLAVAVVTRNSGVRISLFGLSGSLAQHGDAITLTAPPSSNIGGPTAVTLAVQALSSGGLVAVGSWGPPTVPSTAFSPSYWTPSYTGCWAGAAVPLAASVTLVTVVSISITGPSAGNGTLHITGFGVAVGDGIRLLAAPYGDSICASNGTDSVFDGLVAAVVNNSDGSATGAIVVPGTLRLGGSVALCYKFQLTGTFSYFSDVHYVSSAASVSFFSSTAHVASVVGGALLLFVLLAFLYTVRSHLSQCCRCADKKPVFPQEEEA